MRVDPGDALLYAVSSRRSVPWDSFKRAVDGIHATARLPDEIRFLRSDAARLGDALGHWDWASVADTLRIVVAPPVVCRLPWPGMPRAVVCGSRSPDTLDEIRSACARTSAVALRATTQAAVHPFGTTRIELVETADGGLERVSELLQLELPDQPPAWALATAASSLDDYLATLAWSPDDRLDWPRRDFNPSRVAFGPPDPRDVEVLTLSLYDHPQGWTARTRLRRPDGSFAECDRTWGRFAVLDAVARYVTTYAHDTGVVSVPLGLPLPRLLDRALTLCSGTIPRSLNGQRYYASVPIGIQRVVRLKLRQLAAT